GSLYPDGSPKRDGGFTIFYMGINLGAAMSPLLCGYIGETYGWHYGFGLATIGMLTGLAVFVAPTRVTQIMIMTGAIAAAIGLIVFHPDNPYATIVNIFVALAILSAAVISWIALGRGGLPAEAGAPPDKEKLKKPVLGGLLSLEKAVYLGVILLLPFFMLMVSGFAPLTSDNKSMILVSDSFIESMELSSSSTMQVLAVVIRETSRPAGLILFISGIIALIYLGTQIFRLELIQKQRMYVAMILIFFSMLFWSFFEQAGSSINNFTDRNVDRVIEHKKITEDDIGKVIEIQPTQEQLGFHNGDALFTLDVLDKYRKENSDNSDFTIQWNVAADNVGMGLGSRLDEMPASTFQSVNPIFILIFGMVFTLLWSLLNSCNWEPTTPVKFAFGLIQLGLGFGAYWMGAQAADARGMVGLSWLLIGYLLQTTGELCLSPVGLSMITKLSVRLLVSTMMGTWFLATAFSQFLAAIIAQFTGVSHGGNGNGSGIPAPIDTVNLYGDVFRNIAITAIISGLICLALSPKLKKWMHGVH
ncbi:MAG: TGF-beta receptor type I/II extracellular region, partial [Chitinophagaceae bacterium]